MINYRCFTDVSFCGYGKREAWREKLRLGVPAPCIVMIFCIVGASLGSSPASQAQIAEGVDSVVDVYTSGDDGYDTYRIPSVVVTAEGTVLAFAEGRKASRSDTGDIDMLVKRSEDAGRTWSEQIVVWDDGVNTCGNPCAVVDRTTGTIWLLMTHNPAGYHERTPEDSVGTRTVWVTRSDDDGRSWAEPVEITREAKAAEWEWYATGPGVGIQLERGPHAGRLVIPANYSRYAEGVHDRESENRELGALVIYSDDHGKTWRRSEQTAEPRMNESQVAELSDGRLMLNMRSYFNDSARRFSLSDDGGETWGPPIKDATLVEPVCQASLLRHDWPQGSEPGRLLFSNPADPAKRRNLVIRVSEDDGATWPVSRELTSESAAYSCLVNLSDGRIGCFFERRSDDDSSKLLMTLVRFDLTWLYQ